VIGVLDIPFGHGIQMAADASCGREPERSDGGKITKTTKTKEKRTERSEGSYRISQQNLLFFYLRF
jgi:hypothetical protein